MKRANRLGVSYVLIVGDKELAEGSVILRNMATKEQTSISLDNVIESLKRTLSP
jgi:histidyl-tRNA synthetase